MSAIRCDSSSWKLVHPVLQLSWDQLFADTHPWLCEIRPIPKTFRTWQEYLQEFFLPTLENFRCSLGRKLSEFDEFQITFRALNVHQILEESSIWLEDAVGALQPGDVCLISAENPSSKEIGASSRIWDGCGWMLVSHKNKENPALVRCQLFSFDCKTQIVYAAIIDSATTAYRIMKSLDYHNSGNDQTKDMFSEDNINKDLKQVILTCKAPTRPVISMATFDPRIHELFSSLNESQLTAVHACIDAIARPGSVKLIQGPPGTGKTTCIVTLLIALLLQSKTVIQVAPTNIAVLDIARKLIAQKSPEVNPERIVVVVNEKRSSVKGLMDPALEEYVLSCRIHRLLTSAKILIERLVALIDAVRIDDDPDHDEIQLQEICIKSVLEAIQTWDARISVSLFLDISAAIKMIRCFALRGYYAGAAAKIRELQLLSAKNLSQDKFGDFKPKLVSDLEKAFVWKASILFCTLSASKSVLLIPVPFDVAIVDESAQAIEAEMVGLIKASLKSLVLVGDPKQLHGTVFSQICLEAAYQRSLFERLAESHPVHLLTVQYRMHPSISFFPNQTFYDGRIQDSASVQSYNPSWYSERFSPIQFISHQRTSCVSNRFGSWYNEEESLLIALHLGSFLHSVPNHDLQIGVICPYSAQKLVLQQRVADLKSQLNFSAKIKVSTVDGFQGQECDIIIFSLTRTGTTSKFLEQWNRMNVAVTRAKYAFWVFGDLKLFLRDDRSRIWCRFTTHCKSIEVVTRVDPSKHYSNPQIRLLAQCIVLAMKKHERQEQVPSNTMRKRSGRKITYSRDHHVWGLIVSEPVMKELSCCKDSTARAYSLLFSRLLMGDFNGTWRPYRKEKGAVGKLFMLSKVEGHIVLLWTIEIRHGSQAIYAIRPLDNSQLASAWNAFKNLRKEYSKEYLAACSVWCDSNAAPRTGLKDIPKHFWRGAGADDAISGSIKLFDLSDGPFIQMFSSADDTVRSNFLVPYLLDEDQDEAVQYSQGSVVLVGRGGCGKTSVLAQRVLIGYKTAMLNDLDIPRQLFISVSPILIENVKLEFGRLVNTFHSAYEEDIDRPEHSGCTFVSFLDLIFQLDSQIQPRERLFHDKGSVRRLIHQDEDDENDDDDSTPLHQLYTANDIVDFDRFRRLYYPRLSDQVRKLFAPEFIFTEIMFVIKGGNRTDSVGALTFKEYLKLSDSCSGSVVIPDLQRKMLYSAYRCYEKYRLDWHHIDYPDIVANIAGRRGQSVAPVDSLYVDEVQDLMPCHWRLLDLFRHAETQFVCCGDQAQCITAGNRFRFSKLKAFLFESCELKEVKPRQIDLTVNYRTIQEVLALANRILDVIRELFPDEIDRIQGERSARPPPDLWTGTPRLFEEDPNDALSFLFADSKELAAEQIIIVRETAQKEELCAFLESSGWKANVLTILEAKGLEFEDVVVFNMFSSSGVGSQRLRVLLNFVSEVAVQDFDIRKHYELCHFLKELYVAVTRCKHRLLFIDGGHEERQIYALVFQGLIQWTTINTEMSFSRSSTVEEWACKALQYESVGLLREARNAFFKAEQFDSVTRVEAKILITEFEQSREPVLILEAAKLLVKINQLESAATLLYDAKQFCHAAEIYEKLIPGREQEVAECFMLAGCYERSYEALQQFQPVLHPQVFIKIVLKLARSVLSKTITLSEFFLVSRLLNLVAFEHAMLFKAIGKSLEIFVVKFTQPSFDPYVFPRSGDVANVLTAFISILTRFDWIDDGVVFFQTRFSSEWDASINELLRAASVLTESQEVLRCTILSGLVLRYIRDIPVLKQIPKVCTVAASAVPDSSAKGAPSSTPSRSQGGHMSAKDRKEEKKKKKGKPVEKNSVVPRYKQKDPTLSVSNCKKFLTDNIKHAVISLSDHFDDTSITDLNDIKANNLATACSHPLTSCLFAGISAFTLALLSEGILELGTSNIEPVILEILEDSLCLADRQWMRSSPLLFEESARLLKNAGLRKVAAFVFRSVGNALEAISCFEHPGFECDLLEELKMSTGTTDLTVLHAKYSKLAIDFVAIGEHGRALFCISKLPAVHSVHVKQSVFREWLAKRPAPKRAPDYCSAYELSQRFDKEMQGFLDNISCLPKVDVAQIKLCYNDVPCPSASLKEKYGWFVERIIIWVLQAISPANFYDASVIAQNLSYIVMLREGIHVNMPLNFRCFSNGFDLLKSLLSMEDIPLGLIRPVINHVFACSVVYVFLGLPDHGREHLRNYREQVDQYMEREVIEEQATFALQNLANMAQTLQARADIKRFRDIPNLLREWHQKVTKPRNAGIMYALQCEMEGTMSGLRRAAAKYGDLNLKATQARIGKRIDALRNQEELANQSSVEKPTDDEDVTSLDLHTITNAPAVSVTSCWSESQPCQQNDANSGRSEDPPRNIKAILKKPEAPERMPEAS